MRSWAGLPLAAAALAAALPLAGCGAGGYSQAAVSADEALAGRLVSGMAAGQWASVEQSFDAQMQSGLPAAKLSAAWQRNVGTGAVTPGKPTAQSSRGYLVVGTPLQGAPKAVVVRLTFNAAGKVAGLYFTS